MVGEQVEGLFSICLTSDNLPSLRLGDLEVIGSLGLHQLADRFPQVQAETVRDIAKYALQESLYTAGPAIQPWLQELQAISTKRRELLAEEQEHERCALAEVEARMAEYEAEFTARKAALDALWEILDHRAEERHKLEVRVSMPEYFTRSSTAHRFKHTVQAVSAAQVHRA